MQLVKQVKSFGGVIKQYSHESAATKCTMKFSIFLPPTASDSHKVPVLFYLAGLTCNDELLFVKAPEAQRVAASRGIAIVTTDTSPRGVSIPGDEDNWDFGTGAGFYVDATEPKWDEHYRMYSYVTKELPALVAANFPVLEDMHPVMGQLHGRPRSARARNPQPGVRCNTAYLEPGPHYAADSDRPGSRGQLLAGQAAAAGGFRGRVQLSRPEGDTSHAVLPVDVGFVLQDGYDHSYYFIAVVCGGPRQLPRRCSASVKNIDPLS
ncbi:hypothetical protein ON010_g7503 [Phytophthora cinnamomi]|nr:hypothetical protein ON010_g7503 [Phytophthora cinnamomi]